MAANNKKKMWRVLEYEGSADWLLRTETNNFVGPNKPHETCFCTIREIDRGKGAYLSKSYLAGVFIVLIFALFGAFTLGQFLYWLIFV